MTDYGLLYGGIGIAFAIGCFAGEAISTEKALRKYPQRVAPAEIGALVPLALFWPVYVPWVLIQAVRCRAKLKSNSPPGGERTT